MESGSLLRIGLQEVTLTPFLRKVALMALHIQIDTAGILEHARGVFDSELTARKYAWNRSATNWNNTCVPLGYPEIEPVWFYELGPRKL